MSTQLPPPFDPLHRTAEQVGEMRSDIRHVRATLHKHDKRITKLENPTVKWSDLLPWVYGLAILALVAWGKITMAEALGLMGK